MSFTNSGVKRGTINELLFKVHSKQAEEEGEEEMNADEKRIAALLIFVAYLLGCLATYVASNFNSIFHVAEEVVQTDRMRFAQNHINPYGLRGFALGVK